VPSAGGSYWVVFDRDGHALVSGGGATLASFDMRPETWTAAACRIAGRNFTRDEWATYFGDRSYHRTCE